MFLLFKGQSVWCGVRLSRSSSSNAGRGRDYRGHTDKLQHDCTLTHTHTHTEDTEGTQAEALCLSVSLSLSLSVSHTGSHVWCMCSKQCVYWNWREKSVDSVGERRQTSEDSQTTCHDISDQCVNYQCARDHKRGLDLPYFSFRFILSSSLHSSPVCRSCHKHDNKSLSHRSAVMADLTSIYVCPKIAANMLPGDIWLDYDLLPQMFHMGGQVGSVKILG